MAYALSPSVAPLPLSLQIGLFCGGLFICCMFCHGELVRLKPDPAHLTVFLSADCAGQRHRRRLHRLGGADCLQWLLRAAGRPGLVRAAGARAPPARSAIGPFGWVVLLALVCGLVACLVGVTVVQTPPRRVMVRNFYGVLSVIDQLAPGQLQLSRPDQAPQRWRICARAG